MKNRPNVVLGVVTGLVVALAVVAWFVASAKEPSKLDPSTPEGTVQAYILALADDDDEAAVALLDPQLGCKPPLAKPYQLNAVALTLVKSTTNGDEALVVFDLTEYGNTPFDSWSHRESFELLRAGSAWQVTGSPWPIYGCE